MTDIPPISALFVAIAEFALSKGIEGEGFHKFDGPNGLICELNATRSQTNSIPAHTVVVSRPDALIPTAICNPIQGIMPMGNYTEDELIELFKSNTEVRSNG